MKRKGGGKGEVFFVRVIPLVIGGKEGGGGRGKNVQLYHCQCRKGEGGEGKGQRRHLLEKGEKGKKEKKMKYFLPIIFHFLGGKEKGVSEGKEECIQVCIYYLREGGGGRKENQRRKKREKKKKRR